GNLFDGTEIDEILSLRILAMTDEEKREMRVVDEKARRLLERTEALPRDQFLNMHGMMRDPRSPEEQIFGTNRSFPGVSEPDGQVKAGDLVRIRPKARAD